MIVSNSFNLFNCTSVTLAPAGDVIGYQLGTYGFGGRRKDGGFKYSPSLKQGTGLGATHSHPGENTLKDRLESLYGDQGVGQR